MYTGAYRNTNTTDICAVRTHHPHRLGSYSGNCSSLRSAAYRQSIGNLGILRHRKPLRTDGSAPSGVNSARDTRYGVKNNIGTQSAVRMATYLPRSANDSRSITNPSQ